MAAILFWPQCVNNNAYTTAMSKQWGQQKMSAILQTFSNAFLKIKMSKFCMLLHSNGLIDDNVKLTLD